MDSIKSQLHVYFIKECGLPLTHTETILYFAATSVYSLTEEKFVVQGPGQALLATGVDK